MYGPQIPILLGTPDFSPYRLPGLELAYDFTDSSKLKVDASNRVSFAADLSGKSNVMGLVLPGTSGNYASTPDAAPLRVLGDLDVRVLVALDTWTPAASTTFAAKYNSGTSNRGWYFGITAAGLMFLNVSTNGTTISQGGQASVATGLAVFSKTWVRAAYQQSDGSGNNVVTFYTSQDGVTWTQLGTPAINTGTSATFNSNSVVEFGSRNVGAAENLAGHIYRAQIYNGIAGTLVLDENFTAQARGTTSFTESSVNAATVTVNTSGDLGARICGDRDLAMLTGSKQPTLLPWTGANYGWLSGVSGNYFSTPDSAAVSVTGDIDIRTLVALDTWTPAAEAFVVAKWSADNTQNSYAFAVTTSGALKLYGSNNGSVFPAVTSSALTGFSAFSANWIRVTRAVTAGVVTFYTSADGVTWTQLGTTQTLLSGLNLFDGTAAVTVGTLYSAAAPISGKIYRAQIYNGIAGTLVFDADFTRVANNATSFTEFSSNAATVTVNSTGAKPAQIVGRQSLLFDGSSWYTKTAPFPLNQPTTVVLVVKQVTWTIGHYLYDGNINDSLVTYQDTATPRITEYAGANGGSVTDAAIGVIVVSSAIFNGASSSLRTNRNTASTGNASNNNAGGFTLATHGSTQNNPSNIQVSRVFIFSSALDTATLDRLGAWCAARDLVPNF